MFNWLKYLLGIVILIVALLLYSGWASDIPHDELVEQYAEGASDFVLLPSGARAHYRMQGNPEGERIVLLHGSNSSLHTWEPWVAFLTDDYLIITADLPGHGLTGATPADDYTYVGMVDFVKELVQALEIEKFHLGGNSMGGGVTLQYALTYPDDLISLILVDAAGTRTPQHVATETDRPLAFDLAGRWYTDWILENVTPRTLVAEGLTKSVSNTSIITEEMIDRYWHLVRHPGNRRATGLRFAWYRTAGSRDLPVEDIALPALILWGDEDRLIPLESGQAMHSRMPMSKFIVYEGYGHLPMEEAVSETVTDVKAFLAELQARSATAD